MRFYSQRHEFYCGIDLHANSLHACVVDHEGKKALHRSFETRTPERFLEALDPYRDRDLIVGCEATFKLRGHVQRVRICRPRVAEVCPENLVSRHFPCRCSISASPRPAFC